ncbi:DUF4386 domain-containing protein [Lacimicrobium alkaliphilum]|uniref:DUF4386 domain-containing protein n=1 Tax=Lacimicrobium alkaliphilum TaxID=1526571 RepID=A0A0U3B8S8_9ALTE|nr:DUF4386 domain-containing protein [Lacimicrobium alkaliphilum]ALS98085.1 hypothetical protein AT746_07280 [Lacimicrobium alkaliphilum]
MKSIIDSPNTYTRIAGIAYLLIIGFGITGQLFIRGALVDFDNAALTASNILEASDIWRLGIAGDVMMHALDIPVMVILYFLLKPVNKLLALVSVAFNMAQTAVLIANKLVLLVPLIMMSDPQYMSAFESDQISSQVMLLVNIHDYGFALGLVFFGFACVGYGLLLYCADYFPRFIGALMIVAGLSYLTNSLTLLIAPSLSGVVFPILILSLIAELTFALWLIFKGVDAREWQRNVSKGVAY